MQTILLCSVFFNYIWTAQLSCCERDNYCKICNGIIFENSYVFIMWLKMHSIVKKDCVWSILQSLKQLSSQVFCLSSQIQIGSKTEKPTA